MSEGLFIKGKKSTSDYRWEAPGVIRVRSKPEKESSPGFGASLHCVPLGKGRSRILFKVFYVSVFCREERTNGVCVCVCVSCVQFGRAKAADRSTGTSSAGGNQDPPRKAKARRMVCEAQNAKNWFFVRVCFVSAPTARVSVPFGFQPQPSGRGRHKPSVDFYACCVLPPQGLPFLSFIPVFGGLPRTFCHRVPLSGFLSWRYSS